MRQTFTDWEYVLVDHGSRDSSRTIVDSFSEKDPRFRVLTIDINTGLPAVARNTGIRAARGKIIAFLDADDWWYHRKLSNAIDAHDCGADLVYHPLRLYNLETRRLMRGRRHGKIRLRQLKPSVVKELILHGNVIPNSSVTVHKQLIEQAGYVNESWQFRAVEDYDTWIRIARLTDRFHLLPVCLGAYGIGPSNLSAQIGSSNHRASFVRSVHYNECRHATGSSLSMMAFRDAPVRFLRQHYLNLSYLRKLIRLQYKPLLISEGAE